VIFSVELRDLTKIFGGGRTGYEVPAVRGVNLGIHSGEFFTLLGPSGCGKTTTLRLIGGFEVPTSGEVCIQGRSMNDVPPYRRPVNTVFQNYALFPHLTVAQNVAFGLAVRGVPRAEREHRVGEALDLVRLPGMGDRKPSQLSGGQQQRVALARALINDPAVLLLDEPLGALDLKLRKQMQIELKHLQQQVGITFVYVTHDQEEALTMSDRIAVMSEGEVLQVGDPVTIYEKPATRFVADFIGESNFIHGTVASVSGDRAQVSVGREYVYAEVNGVPLSPGQTVTITVRPEKLELARPQKMKSAANDTALTGVVRETVYLGTDTRFVVDLSSGEAVVARLQNTGGKGLGEFSVGDPVKVFWAFQDARALTS
jgi:spermidine/putrescine transport system ATP-binding protein